MKQLIIATGNGHKAEEFAQLLRGSGFEVQSARVCGGMPEVEENGDSFAANALLKAQALQLRVPEGAWVLADDSGLVVDVLNGEPGVYSARYAGPGASDRENLEKLLKAIEGVDAAERTARFICVLCLIGPDGHARTFEGCCEGRIAERPTGEGGFGYDPIFVPDGYEESFAALGGLVKAKLSHRSMAVSKLLSMR